MPKLYTKYEIIPSSGSPEICYENIYLDPCEKLLSGMVNRNSNAILLCRWIWLADIQVKFTIYNAVINDLLERMKEAAILNSNTSFLFAVVLWYDAVIVVIVVVVCRHKFPCDNFSSSWQILMKF